jgi:hypothetical protein
MYANEGSQSCSQITADRPFSVVRCRHGRPETCCFMYSTSVRTQCKSHYEREADAMTRMKARRNSSFSPVAATKLQETDGCRARTARAGVRRPKNGNLQDIFANFGLESHPVVVFQSPWLSNRQACLFDGGSRLYLKHSAQILVASQPLSSFYISQQDPVRSRSTL